MQHAQEEETLSEEDYFSNMEIFDEESMSAMTFTDEDLLLGSKSHNRPLFVTCYAREQKVNRILIDGGSAVNILPLRTMKELGISMDELTSSRLMIQGFNQWGQRALGIIRMNLLMEDIFSTALFHTVLADDKPFTEAESHFADAKYYLRSTKAKQDSSVGKSEQQINQDEKKTTSSAGGNEDRAKVKAFLEGFDSLKELVLPLINIDARKPQPHKEFVRPTQGPEEEYGETSKLQTAKGFDPKAYKLLIKAGYNPQEKDALGKLSPKTNGGQTHGLNATQNMLREKGHSVQSSRDLIISCDKVLKVKLQTIIFTKAQEDDDDDKESVASSYHISCEIIEDEVATTYHITLSEEDSVEEEDAEIAPPELEEGVKTTVDELKEINLGDVENPRPIYISALLTDDEEEAYVELLHEFKNVFAWSYKEMPGLDAKVAVHQLSISKGARPVKQAQR
ncbi:UNVERIFIED_CONTAM: hypothetical protein Slati_4201900 [Sesamum latifolium]|uniref:Uncharacterized protein n=1 Tax=Sesamum latifolium TaxID=2727402 RepID=A0AAW2TAE9_9LAMI